MKGQQLRYGNASHAGTRRGISLVELLVAISLSVFVLTTASTLLHKMFRHQQIATADTRFQLISGRLSHRFRRDVRDCIGCSQTEAAEGQGGELILTTADQSTITYRVDPDAAHLVRREQTASAEGAETTHNDTFTLPASTAVTFAMEKAASSEFQIAQIRIVLPDPTRAFYDARSVPSDAQTQMIIEAVAGRHRAALPKESR